MTPGREGGRECLRGKRERERKCGPPSATSSRPARTRKPVYGIAQDARCLPPDVVAVVVVVVDVVLAAALLKSLPCVKKYQIGKVVCFVPRGICVSFGLIGDI